LVWRHSRTYCKVHLLNATGHSNLTRSSKIAAHIAESAPKEKTVIVDAFAGVGGNAIALARSGRWERVFAIEKDPKTMKCAKHNAEIYGVSSKIFWLTGDCFDAVNRFAGNKNVIIFASPPWGGMCLSLQILSYANYDRHGVRRG
jgi:tRNA G37 N-methylase Trm5